MATVASARQGRAVHMGTGDGVDYLLGLTGGDVLAPPSGDVTGGEYDLWHVKVSAATKRRLNGAGLLRRNGMPADELQHVVAAYLPRAGEMTTDEFVLWYVRTALAGLDARQETRNGDDPWAGYDEHLAARVAAGLEPDLEPAASESAPCADAWPAWVDEMFARLLHAPKIDLLMALVQWHYLGGDVPAIPATPWALKLVARFERRAHCTVPA